MGGCGTLVTRDSNRIALQVCTTRLLGGATIITSSVEPCIISTLKYLAFADQRVH